MTDTLLHIALGAALALVFWQVAALFPAPVAFALMAAFVVYFREVTQRQYGKRLSFTEGWLPWKWVSSGGTLNTQKIIETVIPVAILILGGALIEWGV